ncbi:MAG: hypothetical protein HYZ48_05900 [Chlamydiales bacterium]|nr:hypothetical protein [Chlamydiales bacterium]
MRLIYFLLFLVILSTSLPATEALNAMRSPFKERFQNAQKGDYIVTHQDHTYSVLFIRTIDACDLVLEEVAIAENLIDPQKINWRQWVEKKAPGHTSWTLYRIDLAEVKLLKAFSFSKGGWLYLDEGQQFLSKMLSLPFKKADPRNRRKIGTLSSSEGDHRSFWNPPLFIEGKKQSKPQFDVWEAKWPKDGSAAAGCTIQVYLDQSDSSFPFPHWIEIQSPHYCLKIRSIDSGHGMRSLQLDPH